MKASLAARPGRGIGEIQPLVAEWALRANDHDLYRDAVKAAIAGSQVQGEMLATISRLVGDHCDKHGEESIKWDEWYEELVLFDHTKLTILFVQA